MESRANTALIGAFTLGVLALAFVFIYWLARDSWGADRRILTVEFSGPVTGMTPGSEVLFNGINVGTVKSIEQDPADPGRVIVQLSVDANQPIKDDTRATVGIQGLTGLGYMKLVGGSKDKPNLFATPGPVALEADPAATEDLLTAAGELMARADTILKEVEDLVKTNRAAVDASVANVQSFTEALSENSDKIATFVDSVAGAADGITTLSKRLEGVVDKSEAILGAVEPDDVRQTITQLRETADNVSAFSESLSSRSGDIDRMVTQFSAISSDINQFSARLTGIGERADTLLVDVGDKAGKILDAVDPETVSRALGNIDRIAAAVEPEKVGATIDGLASFSQTLSDRREEIDTLVTRLSAISGDVGEFSARLPAMGEKADNLLAAVDAEAVSRAVGNIDRIAAAIEPEKVGTTIDGLASFSQTLSNRQEDIDTMVTRLSTIANDVGEFSERLPGMGEKADNLLAAVDAEAVSRAVGNIDRIAAAIEPEKVGTTIDGLASFSQTLSNRREDIDTLVTQLSTIASDVSGFSARLPTMGEKVDNLLAAVDAEKVTQSVDGVHQFATSLGENSDDIDEIVANVRAVSERFDGLTAKAESLIAKLDTMAGGENGGIIEEASRTLTAIRKAAESFDRQTQVIGSGVGRFSNQGLRDLQEFVNEGRRTVSRLDRVISNLGDDPSQILFGGRGVPEYRGNRR